MAGNRYLELISSGDPQERAATQTSAGAADAGKIPALDAAGKLDQSLFYSETVQTYQASENITAGDFVNIWNDAGTVKVRRASATSASMRAHGFSPNSITSGNSDKISLTDGTNVGVAGLSLATEYFLSATTPGGVTDTPPTADGHFVQKVGVTKGTAELEVHIDPTIYIRNSST